jgi:exosome complex component RRP4
MGNILVEEQDIVTPGETLAEGMDYIPGKGTYRDDDEIVSKGLSLIKIDGSVIKGIPMNGRYTPEEGDRIIGRVKDILMSGWKIDINSAYDSMLPLKDASHDYIEKGSDLTRYFDIDDYVAVKITSVSTQKMVDITAKGQGLKKLEGGRIINVNPQKVPRIIGSRGSMISIIKKALDCNIFVGQNGLVWLNGAPENEVKAIQAIRRIEREAHTAGLTERISDMLDHDEGDNS